MSTGHISPRKSRALSHDQNIGHDQHVGGNAWARLYRGQTHYDFINRWRYWFALSGTIIAVGLVALGVRGLNFSIDFKGGTVWEVPATASVKSVSADLGKISSTLSQATVTQLTNRQTGKTNIEVQAPATLTSNSTLVQQVTKELAAIGHVSQDEVTLNAIGPSWGSDITGKAVEAVIVFLVLISACIAIYFESRMAVAALVALVHDMLVTVGIYALSGFQVSPDTVIAFLTVLGYSLYDTIVVFDKVKENTRGLASTNRVTYTDVVNLSMNQVLARSINTSFVAIMPVFCILVIGSWILGATALNDFGLALFIGLMSGAYSSIFIASPILAILKEREPRYVEIRRRLAAYPSSRQVLTPATVAGGVLLGAAKTSGTATGTSFAGAGTGTSFADRGRGTGGPSAGAAAADVLSGPGWRRPAARRSNGGTGNAGTGNGGIGNGGTATGAGGGNGAPASTDEPAMDVAFESYAGPLRPRAGAPATAPTPDQPDAVVPDLVIPPAPSPRPAGAGDGTGAGGRAAKDQGQAGAGAPAPTGKVPPRPRGAPPRARKKAPRRR
jgi:preprotein translocase subunit SecF